MNLIVFFLGSSNTSHIESLDRFRKSVVDKVKIGICIFFNHPKENNTKIQYANEFIKNWGWVILKHMFINLFTIKKTMITRR